MKSMVLALAAASVVAAGSAAAATIDHDSRTFVRTQYGERYDQRAATIDEREARIRARIDRGIDDGRITRREARRLYGELRAIEWKERAFRSDGRINRREDAELGADLDRLAWNVRHQLRDDDRRY